MLIDHRQLQGTHQYAVYWVRIWAAVQMILEESGSLSLPLGGEGWYQNFFSLACVWGLYSIKEVFLNQLNLAVKNWTFKFQVFSICYRFNCLSRFILFNRPTITFNFCWNLVQLSFYSLCFEIKFQWVMESWFSLFGLDHTILNSVIEIAWLDNTQLDNRYF